MTQAPTPSSTRRTANKRRFFLAVSIFVFIGVIFYIATAENTIDVNLDDTPPQAQIVSIETAQVSAETVEVSSVAEVRPRWSAELRAATSGRITEVLKSALAGGRVESGTTLVTTEKSQYVAQVAATQHTLSEARLALRKAENKTAIARREFNRDGSNPPSDLAVHLPELRIAQSAVEAAKARVAAAKRQLADTDIVAPFSGFITNRFVSLGQTVNSGDPIVKLVDDTNFELTVELSKNNWELLQKPLSGLEARIINQRDEFIATAKIRQGGGFLDEKTRQFKVFLDIEAPGSGSVLSGDFVSVILPGITMSSALNIPASALTQEGFFWYVDDQNRLRRTSPRILFRRQDRIIIQAPSGAINWRIAKTPLVSFLPGQLVQTKEAEE